MNDISGCVAARNSVKFGYPLRECLQALRPICDEVVLAYDLTAEDGTYELAQELRQELDLRLVESPWDMTNMEKGLEIGRQSQVAVENARCEWQLCVQQDEAFHEEDKEKIWDLVEFSKSHTIVSPNGFDFIRPYFYGNLHTIRKDWSVTITRLTYKGTHTYAGFDGQNSKPLVQPVHMDSGGIWLFHYSRIGDPTLIAKRVRNVDSFFHPEESLPKEEELTPYDFTAREYDSYAITENPKEVKGEFLYYEGMHPAPFARLYKDYQ